MEFSEYQNETCCVIEEQQSMDGVAIMTCKQVKHADVKNPVLFTGTFEECDNYRKQYTPDNPYISEYIIQDDIWPSRRWNADRTDYIDLSGE